jgi:hypothetical protein
MVAEAEARTVIAFPPRFNKTGRQIPTNDRTHMKIADLGLGYEARGGEGFDLIWIQESPHFFNNAIGVGMCSDDSLLWKTNGRGGSVVMTRA